MFGTAKTAKFIRRNVSGVAISLKPKLFTIRWYPSSRGFSSAKRRRFRPNLMPPLMVRKPEWRR